MTHWFLCASDTSPAYTRDGGTCDGGTCDRGGSRGDTIFGGNNDNEIAGKAGNTKRHGMARNDHIYSGPALASDDYCTLFGGAGNDQMKSVDGNDRVYGGAAMDVLDRGRRVGQFVFYAGARTGKGDPIGDFDLGVGRLMVAGLTKGADMPTVTFVVGANRFTIVTLGGGLLICCFWWTCQQMVGS